MICYLEYELEFVFEGASSFFSISNSISFFRRESTMDEITLKRLMQSKDLTVLDGSLAERVGACIRAVEMSIPPRSQSDRTCLKNVDAWLLKKCHDKRYPPEEILPRVIDFGLEASGPKSRNPGAVFMSILKKELKYPY